MGVLHNKEQLTNLKTFSKNFRLNNKCAYLKCFFYKTYKYNETPQLRVKKNFFYKTTKLNLTHTFPFYSHSFLTALYYYYIYNLHFTHFIAFYQFAYTAYLNYSHKSKFPVEIIVRRQPSNVCCEGG